MREAIVSPLAFALFVGTASLVHAQCPAGSTCPRVDERGAPDSSGAFTAQCTGNYPDFVDQVPASWTGRRFKLSQSYPSTAPTSPAAPWKAHNFKTAAGADAYLLAVRNYFYAGMVAADWRGEANSTRRWYHVPWMTLRASDRAPLPREFIRGLTQERSTSAPELGLKQGRSVQNWAIGFYNPVGGYTIGRVWANPTSPQAAQSQFRENAAVVKVLFSAAKADDFAAGDLLEGAPEWDANIRAPGGTKTVGKVRLLQMDVAVRDARAGVTGWVFGTFAYDKNAPGTDGWKKMVPVGLMWGNDPAVDEIGDPLHETIVSAQAPQYAKDHLGWQGRMNGPVDNPASACMSCHSTAQVPSSAPLAPTDDDCDATEKQVWFRNISGSTPFGRINDQCVRSSSTTGLTALDYSLQMAVAFRMFRTSALRNPCIAAPPAAPEAVAPELAPSAEPEYDVIR